MGIEGRVRLAGLVSPSRICQMLWAMDMLVHTSDHEGLPLVLVQGLLAGLPVASFDLDGAREVIESDKIGYLLSPWVVDELIGAIEATLSGRGSAKPMCEQDRARLARRFSWVDTVDKLEELYSLLLN